MTNFKMTLVITASFLHFTSSIRAAVYLTSQALGTLV